MGEPTCDVPAPHGNSIANRPYIRRNPSLLNSIKEAVSATGDQTGPGKIYKKAVWTGTVAGDIRMQPRDMKQVLAMFEVVQINCGCFTK